MSTYLSPMVSCYLFIHMYLFLFSNIVALLKKKKKQSVSLWTIYARMIDEKLINLTYKISEVHLVQWYDSCLVLIYYQLSTYILFIIGKKNMCLVKPFRINPNWSWSSSSFQIQIESYINTHGEIRQDHIPLLETCYRLCWPHVLLETCHWIIIHRC